MYEESKNWFQLLFLAYHIFTMKLFIYGVQFPSQGFFRCGCSGNVSSSLKLEVYTHQDQNPWFLSNRKSFYERVDKLFNLPSQVHSKESNATTARDSKEMKSSSKIMEHIF